MKNNNYSISYINAFKTELRELFEKSTKDESYLEYYKRIIEPRRTNFKRNNRLDILTIIMNFDLYGKLPDRTLVKHKIIDNSNYSKLCDEFRNVIDTYVKVARKTAMKDCSIHDNALSGSIFLLYLQNKNVMKIRDITEKDVISFFVNENNELIFSCSYKKKIKSVFKACIPYIENAEKIMNYLPQLKYHRKNIQFLKKDELASIKNILDNPNSTVSLRNKAIVTILLYTGLRRCDVANLKLDNIDWNNETINIIQIKTNNPLELPLLAPVGNAIYQYIMNERPKTEFSNIFIRENSNLPITKSTIYNAICKVMDEANVRMNKGERRGSHLFRYNIAISLLENEIPQPVISETLGHSSSKSVEDYLNADIVHLRKCALSIELFPYQEVNF